MPFAQIDALKIFKFTTLTELGVTHAVFTRQGGVSRGAWDSLNLGSTVGDDPVHVAENHRRALEPYGLERTDLFDVWQVHGSEVAVAEHARPAGTPHIRADIILTGKVGLPLFMRFADCVPIFLYDHQRRAAGLVHSGWQGTVRKAVQVAVQSMQQHFGSEPGDIQAAVGPSIGPDHYEVGEEVLRQVERAFGNDAWHVLPRVKGSYHFDLWRANELMLRAAGVGHIEQSNICTACFGDDWYSHRRDQGKTGRFGAFISIPD